MTETNMTIIHKCYLLDVSRLAAPGSREWSRRFAELRLSPPTIIRNGL